MQPSQETFTMQTKMNEQINAGIIHGFICTQTLHFTGERTKVQRGKVQFAEPCTFDLI